MAASSGEPRACLRIQVSPIPPLEHKMEEKKDMEVTVITCWWHKKDSKLKELEIQTTFRQPFYK